MIDPERFHRVLEAVSQEETFIESSKNAADHTVNILDNVPRQKQLEAIAMACEESENPYLASFGKLIRSKGHFHVKDDDGFYTALRYASSVGEARIVALIFEIITLYQRSPSPSEIINEIGKNGYTGLMEAVCFGDIETVKLWLDNPYIDLNAHNQGNESLRFQNPEVRDLIIQKMQEQGIPTN